MFLLHLLFLSSIHDASANQRALIEQMCVERHGRYSAAAKSCSLTQRKAMARFVVILTAFEDPGKKTAKRCLATARRGKYVDWPIAKTCMQAAAKGKRVGGKL